MYSKYLNYINYMYTINYEKNNLVSVVIEREKLNDKIWSFNSVSA
jgi:hypothetical protein